MGGHEWQWLNYGCPDLDRIMLRAARRVLAFCADPWLLHRVTELFYRLIFPSVVPPDHEING